jgi:hypothetical protein
VDSTRFDLRQIDIIVVKIYMRESWNLNFNLLHRISRFFVQIVNFLGCSVFSSTSRTVSLLLLGLLISIGNSFWLLNWNLGLVRAGWVWVGEASKLVRQYKVELSIENKWICRPLL